MVNLRFLRRARGFTLIEAIMAIVITGIIASMVSVFIKTSIDSYLSAVRRAELTDAADVALRRLARELRLAVPNSLRIATSGGTSYIEFVPTKEGGRYRNVGDGSASGNYLCTGNTPNAIFDVLGPMPGINMGDAIVVFNDASLNGGPGCASPSNVYCGGSRAVATNAASPLTINASPFFGNGNVICSYANNRFQVVDQNVRAVTYSCPGASGTVTRYWNYGFNATQAAPPAGGSSATVAQNAVCSVNYVPNVLQRNALLAITLTLTDPASGESIVAFREIHVDNAP